MRALRASLPILGIIALVVLDIGLVYLAYEHTRSDAASDVDSGAQPTRAGTTSGESTTDGDDTTPDASPPQGSSISRGEVLLDSASDGTVVRASRGDCESDDERSTIEVSSDSGATFIGAGIGGLADVLRVSASGADNILVVGADADCTLMAYTSDDGGDSWHGSRHSDPYWHLSLGSPDTVHAPGGEVEPGCDVEALLPLTEAGARVLCSTDELRGTADAGAEWASLGSLEGAVGVYYVDTGIAWAVGTSDECDAAVYRTSDGGAQWRERACLDGDPPQAVSVSVGVVTIQTGGEIQTSDDGGESWSTP